MAPDCKKMLKSFGSFKNYSYLCIAIRDLGKPRNCFS